MHMKKTRLLVTTADADYSIEFSLLLDYSTTRSLHEIAALFINSLHLKKKLFTAECYNYNYVVLMP